MLMTLAVGQGLKTDTSLLEPDIELTEMLSRQSRIFAWSKTAENSSLQGSREPHEICLLLFKLCVSEGIWQN